MQITDETIAYTAELAKLRIDETEREQVRTDLEQVLSYLERMKELDTAQVEPLSHVQPLFNVFREDVVTNTEQRERLLAEAPAVKNGAYLVPKTVE